MPQPRIVVALLVCVLWTSPAIAAPEPAHADIGPPHRQVTRVRPYDARSAVILRQGLERSETLRNMVEQLGHYDVIAYVQVQPALSPGLAGALTWMSATGTFRYVRISLNPALSMETLIAALGHELQHALEVAMAPEIRSVRSLEAFYSRHGTNAREHRGWDTVAAQDAGETVRRELASARRTPATVSLEARHVGDATAAYRPTRGSPAPE